jgi:hypothetical protein
MMLAAVETVAKADPIGASGRHESDIAAKTAAGDWVHAGLFRARRVGFRGVRHERYCGFVSEWTKTTDDTDCGE